MPRKRTSTTPPKRRARIGTREECRREMQRTIHRCDNEEITQAFADRRIDMLKNVFNTLPDVGEQIAYISPAISIISCPPDHGICPDGNTRPNFEAAPLWDAEHARRKAEQTSNHTTRSDDDDQHDNVSPLRLLAPIDQEFKPKDEREKQLLAEIEALISERRLEPEQFVEAARRAGYLELDELKNEIEAILSRLGVSVD